MAKYSKKERDKIIDSLKKDRVIVLLTDTVYGLMARASRENEIKINLVKERDINKKISVIFPDFESLEDNLIDISYYKKEYMREKLPGKYTFIVRLKKFKDFRRDDFGVRITTNNYLQDIIKEVGPVLASSCNINGRTPCHSILEIEKEFRGKDIDIVIDKENSSKASTIISLLEDIEVVRD